jgi:hypothetical protein
MDVVVAGRRACRLRRGGAWRLSRSEWCAWADAIGMEYGDVPMCDTDVRNFREVNGIAKTT